MIGGVYMYQFTAADFSLALVDLVAAYAPHIFLFNAVCFAVDTITGAFFGRGLFAQKGDN